MNTLTAIETRVLSEDLKSINGALSGYSASINECHYRQGTGEDLVTVMSPRNFDKDKYNLGDFFDSLTDEEKTWTSRRTITGNVTHDFEIDIPDGEDADDFIEYLSYGDVEENFAIINTDSVTTYYNLEVAITTSVMNKLKKYFIPLRQEVA